MYDFNQLVAMYRSMPIKQGATISIKTDLLKLGRFEVNNKMAILKSHLDALDEAFNLDRTTLVVSTGSTNLCNTTQPYDPKNTPSMVGAFTEHLRKQSGALRSFHAFESFTALGASPESICANTSPMSYGCESPESRMVEADAWCIVLGANPIRCCSTIHHLEHKVGVPYRYIQSYDHPVVENSTVSRHIVYRNTWYGNSDIRKDTIRFFQKLRERGFEFLNYPMGNGVVSLYPLKDICRLGVPVLHDDPYLCLEATPTVQPWRAEHSTSSQSR